MPDQPHPKPHDHPWQRARQEPTDAPLTPAGSTPIRPAAPGTGPFAELGAVSNFSFLTGGSHPEEMVQRAAELGYRGLGIADRHTLAGIVRAHVAAKAIGLPLAVGARIMIHLDVPSDQPATGSLQTAVSGSLELLLYPTDRSSYGRLCRLLTVGKRRTVKGDCRLFIHDLLDHHEGLLAIALPGESVTDEHLQGWQGLRAAFGAGRLAVAMAPRFDGHDRDRFRRIADLARHLGVDPLATNDPLYHHPDRRPLQDVLTCIREHRTLPTAGFRLRGNAERHLKPPRELARLFADYPRALARAVAFFERASGFSLDQLRYQYPRESCPPGVAPIGHLRELTYAGARTRYPRAAFGSGGLPEPVRQRLDYELALIDELNYPHYFLTVYDIVKFARARGILCQGRGAAANSAVCYCLGVTAVDPARVDLLFERFISRERNEPPDIDIDFEHERREEVIQYVYGKYGRDRAALTAEVISYRSRSAIREVGKALGLSLDAVDRLARGHAWFDRDTLCPAKLRELGFDPADPTMGHLHRLTRELLGFPRHLSQHVGGFVITDGPLCESVPIENASMPDRTIIEWDKDDIDAVGMLKVDCLGLGMLTAVSKAMTMIGESQRASEPCGDGGRRGSAAAPDVPDTPDAPDLASIPPEDPAVYDMLCRADAVGVFQVESRAQLSMLPRLEPRRYYDLVIEVAIVRPGPIVGDMVHPYLRRRRGKEPVTYPDEAVKQVLGRTLGVPLFQEQAMSLAIRCAGFSPDEADQLRRAIAAWKRKQKVIYTFGQRIVEGMTARGYDADFAHQCFERMRGFSEYGFPESHAASFALIVYSSAWIKRYYPAAFCAALINSQPMGFYAPAQLVQDARQHGVETRPVDVNHSRWDCTLERDRSDEATRNPTSSARAGDTLTTALRLRRDRGLAVRLGMRMVKGLAEDQAHAIARAVRTHGPFTSIDRLWRASGVRVAAMRRLAEADAFASMGLDRRQALWEVRQLRDDPLPLFDHLDQEKGGNTGECTDEDTPASPPPPPIVLPPTPPIRDVVRDYNTVGLSLKQHPVAFQRQSLHRRGVTPCGALADPDAWPHGSPVAVAGLVLVRQRPGSASGVVFITLEDETGIANLILWPRVFDRFRRIAAHRPMLLARGKVQRDEDAGRVVHVLVRRIQALDPAHTDTSPDAIDAVAHKHPTAPRWRDRTGRTQAGPATTGATLVTRSRDFH